jgi:CHRD domain-containing protein
MIAAMRAALLLVCAAGVVLSAQAGRTFKARLAPVPIDLTMQATVAGSGTVTASLAGTKLTITGTFDGLKSPATTAKIRKSPVRGVRGPEILTLTVSGATSGTIAGQFDLTPQQLADLQGGRLYVQLHSEKAPDGNLWGWLIAQDKR